MATLLKTFQLGLTLHCCKQTLIKQLSFSLSTGEIMVIAGTNGSGKTTLLHLLAGLLQPTEGHILLEGKALSSYSPAERARQIAVVQQNETPHPHLRLIDYVSLGRIPYSKNDDFSVDSLLAEIGLIEKREQKLGSLSGGERQRAALARALCQQPKLLLLDEPTNHLDPAAKGEILSIAASQQISLIAVLHDLQLIPSFADTVLVLQNGEMAGFGAIEEVFTPPFVKDIFNTDFFYFQHPQESRLVPCVDIPLSCNRHRSHNSQ